MERAAPLLDQPHLESVRDGLTSLFPVLTLGGLSLLLRDLPLSPWQAAIASSVGLARGLEIVFDLTFGSFSLYVVCAVAYRLARRKAIRWIWPTALAVVAFGIVTRTRVWPEPAAHFGPENLLVAIFAALFTVEAYERFLAPTGARAEPNSTSKMGLPAIHSVLFASGLIGLACLFRLVRQVAAYRTLVSAATRVVSGFSSGPACVLAEAAHSVLWVMGINGNLILGSALQPLLTGNAVANSLARWSGQTPPWIYSDLFRIYVAAGGSGATLPLAICLARSRSPRLRQVGRQNLLPGLCNFNHGLIFGAPIVFNPLLALPFVAVTALNAAVAYLAHSLGWVTPAYIYLPRAIPAPLLAFLATGYDGRALALSVVTWLVIPGIIWLPFFMVWEKRILAAESVDGHSNVGAIGPPDDTD